MTRFQLQGAMLMIGWLVSLKSSTQISDPTHAKGKITIQKSPDFNIPGVSKMLAEQLRTGIEQIRDFGLQDSLLKNPLGFGVIANISSFKPSKELPWQNQKMGSVSFDFSELYFDEGSNNIKSSGESDAGINIQINSFRDLYPDTYSNSIAEINYIVPSFFFKYSIKQTDSTASYIEFIIQNSHPVRAIVNDQSIFVPFTKEQYLQYKIATDKNALTSATEENKKNEETVNAAKQHLLTSQKEPTKTELLRIEMTNDSALINNYQQLGVLDAGKKLVDTWTHRLNKHREQLASLSGREKKAPAFIVWKVSPGDPAADNLEELTGENDQTAEELWTINPGYFNKGLPLTVIQLITVTPFYHPQMTSLFLREKCMDVFKTLDYKKLKSVIGH